MSRRTLRHPAVMIAVGVLSFSLIAGSFWLSRGPAKVSAILESVAHGERLVYRIELESTAKAKGQVLSHIRLTGQLSLEPTRIRNDPAVTARLEQAQLENVATRRSLSQLETSLASPLVYELDAHGAISRLREDPRAPEEVRHLLKSIVTLSQLSTSAKNEPRWTAEERDTLGVYSARYQRRDDHVTKRKERYSRMLGASSDFLNEDTTIDVLSFIGKFDLGARGHIAAVEIDEELRTRSGYVGDVTSKTRLRMQLVGAPQERTPSAVPKGLHVTTLGKPAGQRTYSIAADRERVGDRTMSQLLDMIEELPAYAERTDDQKREGRVAFMALAARLRLGDEEVAAVVDEIKGGSDIAKSLWAALGSAGTPIAQKGLREVIDMPQWSLAQRRSQMIVLSFVATPTQETVEFLKQKVSDPEQGPQAIVGLGTAAQHLSESQPESAEDIYSYLVDQLAQTQDRERQIHLIDAIGNTGNPAALEVLAPYVVHFDAALRRPAVSALRMLPREECDVLLADALDNDGDGGVRLTAVQALGTRSPSTSGVSALMRASTDDDDSSIRRAANDVLTSLANEHPQIAQAVDQYRATHPAKEG